MSHISSEWYRENVLPRIPRLLEDARWYSGKGRRIEVVKLLDFGVVDADSNLVMAVIQVSYSNGSSEKYLLPQILGKEGDDAVLDATGSVAFVAKIMSTIFQGLEIRLENGRLTGNTEFDTGSPINNEEEFEIRRISGEQSNTSVIIGGSMIYKNFRKISPGDNPDYTVCSYLFRKCGFNWVPETVGKLVLQTGGIQYDAGTLSRYVGNSGDGFKAVTEQIKEMFYETGSGNFEKRDAIEGKLRKSMDRLGVITAGVHNCLSSHSSDAEFEPESVTEENILQWSSEYKSLLEETVESVGEYIQSGPGRDIKSARYFYDNWNVLAELADSLGMTDKEGIHKTRVHGDFHLGQVLVSGENFYIIDFEGEPMRSMEYRTSKLPPLKDIGGMVRSIEYAVDVSVIEFVEQQAVMEYSESLKKKLLASFIEGYYRSYSPVCEYLPKDGKVRAGMLNFYIAEKALYEVGYELRNRPGFAWIPLKALQRLIEGLNS